MELLSSLKPSQYKLVPSVGGLASVVTDVNGYAKYDYAAPVAEVVITDNGDGTWTADDKTGTHLSFTDAPTNTVFQLANVSAPPVDANSYTISDTFGNGTGPIMPSDVQLTLKTPYTAGVIILIAYAFDNSTLFVRALNGAGNPVANTAISFHYRVFFE